MSQIPKRDISPILQALRNFLLGRKHITALRYAPELATRSPNPPDLPAGPHALYSANYYYTRDARHEVTPPQPIVGEGSAPQLEAQPEPAQKLLVSKTPGKSYAWD